VKPLTCYFRHLHDFFDKAGIKVTDENKKQIDQIIHNIMKVKYKNCSATWKEVKKRMAKDEEAFISQLKKALS